MVCTITVAIGTWLLPVELIMRQPLGIPDDDKPLEGNGCNLFMPLNYLRESLKSIL